MAKKKFKPGDICYAKSALTEVMVITEPDKLNYVQAIDEVDTKYDFTKPWTFHVRQLKLIYRPK